MTNGYLNRELDCKQLATKYAGIFKDYLRLKRFQSCSASNWYILQRSMFQSEFTKWLGKYARDRLDENDMALQLVRQQIWTAQLRTAGVDVDAIVETGKQLGRR